MPVPGAATVVVGAAERDMRLIIHGKRTVVPPRTSEPLILPVTSLDAAMANFYLHNVYYFDRLDGSDGDRQEQLEQLHRSLGGVLNAFPVVAGRLRVLPDGSLGIKLNDAGIRMFEASVDVTLREWLDRAASTESPTLTLYPTEIHIVDYSISPLVAVQCTQFRCGGVAIGLSWSHVVGDISSMAVFMRLWGESHGGATSFSIEPSFKLEPGSKNGVNHAQSALVVHGSQEKQEPPHKLDSRVLQLGPKAVESMMAAAPGLSEAEAVCAHIWAGVSTTETSASRKHFLWRDDSNRRPANYFGNGALAFQLAEATRDESCAVALGRGDNGCDTDGDSGDLVFCAWAGGARCYDVDFGGVKPFLVEALLEPPSSLGLGGAAVAVLPGAESGRSKAVGLSLRPEAMKKLLRDDNISASCRSLQQQQRSTRQPMPVAGAPAA